MKKSLLLLALPILLLSSCRPDPKKGLPDFVGPKSNLVPDVTSLTTDPSSSPEIVSILVSDSEETYEVEIGAGVSLREGNYPQIKLNPGCYIKSVSTFKVDRLIIDFYGAKGVNYSVYNNVDGSGSPVKEYESSITPTEPEDGGMVLQFPINSTGWIIKNETEFNKPTFYSITICLDL